MRLMHFCASKSNLSAASSYYNATLMNWLMIMICGHFGVTFLNVAPTTRNTIFQGQCSSLIAGGIVHI